MSDTDGNTPVEVDVDTDNLDDFSDTFFGKTKEVKVEESVDEEVDPQEEDLPVEADADAEAEADTEESVDSDDDEEEADDESEAEPAHKNRKTAKERIRELSAQKREEKAARLEAEARLAQYEARLAKLENTEPKPVVAVEANDIYPDPDAVDADGDLIYPLGKLDPKYNAEVVRNTLRVEREAQMTEDARLATEREQQSAQQALVNEWNGKLATAEEVIPDIREKLADLEDTFSDLEPTHGIFIAETIMQMDRGVEVLNYLADNIGEAEAIVALSPRKAVISLGRIEGRLPSPEVAKEGSKQKVSKAPKPPISTRGTGVGKRVAADTDDLEAFEREFFQRK